MHKLQIRSRHFTLSCISRQTAGEIIISPGTCCGLDSRVLYHPHYRSAVLYSHIVDPIFQEGVTATGTNLTAVIEKFRYQMQNSMHTNASIEHGQWWFDNMTLYLDTLLIIQQVRIGVKV